MRASAPESSLSPAERGCDPISAALAAELAELAVGLGGSGTLVKSAAVPELTSQQGASASGDLGLVVREQCHDTASATESESWSEGGAVAGAAAVLTSPGGAGSRNPWLALPAAAVAYVSASTPLCCFLRDCLRLS